MPHFARLPITDAMLAAAVGAAIISGEHAVALHRAGDESLFAEFVLAPLLRPGAAAGATVVFTATDAVAIGAGALIVFRFLVWSVEVGFAVLLGSWIEPERIAALSRLLAWIVSPLLAATVLLGDVQRGRSSELTALPPEAAPPTRFVDAPVVTFALRDRAMFMTPGDVVAMASASIITVRFLAWSLGPLVAAARRGPRDGPGSDG